MENKTRTNKEEIKEIKKEIEGLKVVKKRLKEIGFFGIARQKIEDIRELKRKLIKLKGLNENE